MNVLITGGTGFVGRHLKKKLQELGHQINILTRNSQKYKNTNGVKYISWNPLSETPIKDAFIAADGSKINVVINLLGENISAGRWTADQKDKIYNSRILGTKNLIKGIENHCSEKIDLLISTSAIGIYEANLPEEINENGVNGKGFLSRVCEDWEKEAEACTNTQRTLITRVGVVFGHDGGALERLLPVFKLGGGGPIGNGKQIMSWIHVEDLVNIYLEAMENQNYQGVVNAVSPNYVTNSEFTKYLGAAVKRPALFPVPPQALKLIFGEMSSIILDSQTVVPKALQDLGHKFLYPEADRALENIGQRVNLIGRPL